MADLQFARLTRKVVAPAALFQMSFAGGGIDNPHAGDDKRREWLAQAHFWQFPDASEYVRDVRARRPA